MSAGATVWLIYAPAASLRASGVNEKHNSLRVKRKPSITTWNKKAPFFTLLMSTNQLNSLVTFSLTAWLNITIFYNSTEAQCRWLKEGIAILMFVVKFGISTEIVLNKSHPTPSVKGLHWVSWCSLIQLGPRLGAADICGFPHWDGRTFARWLLWWVDMYSSLLSITEDKWPQGAGHVHSAFSDKNLYFHTAVVLRHTLLVIQNNSIGCN